MSSSLLNQLQSYWRLDESTGNRLDSVGSRHLIPSGTVGGASGKNGLGAYFSGASNNFLSTPSDSVLKCDGSSFTFAGWFKSDVHLASLATALLIDKLSTTGKEPLYDWRLICGSGSITFEYDDWNLANSASSYNVTQSLDITSSLHHFAAILDLEHDQVRLYVDNIVSSGTNPLQFGFGSGTNAPFRLRGDGASSDSFNGIIDEVGFWNRALTSGEIYELWNGGSGYFLPFGPVSGSGSIPLYMESSVLSSGSIPLYVLAFGDTHSGSFPTYISGSGSTKSVADSLCSYWTLNETTGQRLDSVGTHHMSPYGDVSAVGGKSSLAVSFGNLPTDYTYTNSDVALQTGGHSFSFSTWFELKTSSEMTIVSKRGEWELRVSSTGAKFIFNDGENRVLTHAKALTVGGRYFICARINFGTKTAYLRLNNDADSTLSFANSTISSDEPLIFTYSYYPCLDFSRQENSQYIGVL